MARQAARVMKDFAGGVILGKQIHSVFINGTTPAAIGDAVEPHHTGHHRRAPTMTTGSNNVIIENKIPCRQSDSASCGHTIVSGSNNTFIN